MLEALKIAHTEIKKHCLVQKELTEAVGKTKKREYCHEVNDEGLRIAVKKSHLR
jgi:polyribonucleotide nucleotidyltransferase